MLQTKYGSEGSEEIIGMPLAHEAQPENTLNWSHVIRSGLLGYRKIVRSCSMEGLLCHCEDLVLTAGSFRLVRVWPQSLLQNITYLQEMLN